MTDYICTQCLYIGTPKKQKRGSTAFEALGWALFPLGIPYTIWRMMTKVTVCRHCGESMLTPVTSAVGEKLVAKIEADIAGIPLTGPLKKTDEQTKSTPSSENW